MFYNWTLFLLDNVVQSMVNVKLLSGIFECTWAKVCLTIQESFIDQLRHNIKQRKAQKHETNISRQSKQYNTNLCILKAEKNTHTFSTCVWQPVSLNHPYNLLNIHHLVYFPPIKTCNEFTAVWDKITQSKTHFPKEIAAVSNNVSFYYNIL